MNTQDLVFDLTEQSFNQVIELSRQVPVILDFWADWCQPCQQLGPVLERLVQSLQGQVLLARIDTTAEVRLAEYFQVRSLPTLKLVFQGQIVSELTGLQTESALRQWLEPVLGDGALDEEAAHEAFLEDVRQAIAQGQGPQAEAALRQFLEQFPDQHRFRALLVEYLLQEGRRDEAESLLAEVAEDVEPLRPFRHRLALLDELKDWPQRSAADWQRLLEQGSDEERASARYALGLQAVAANQVREGLESLLALLGEAPDWNDGAARRGLLKVFEALPKGDPLASEYRRRMFTALHR